MSQTIDGIAAMEDVGGSRGSNIPWAPAFVFDGLPYGSTSAPPTATPPPDHRRGSSPPPLGAFTVGAPASCTDRAVVEGPPVLLDCSAREGSCRGGTTLWFHGKRLRPEMTVAFGGVAAKQAVVVSGQLVKLVTPPSLPHNAHQRHQVLLELVDRKNGARCSSSSLVFEYVPITAWSPPPSATPPPLRQGLLQELLQRLRASLQRAHAAAAEAAADAEIADATAVGSSARRGDGGSSLALFEQVDEHGYSLGEYEAGLHKMMASLGWADGERTSDLAGQQAGASELQMQHQELAALVTRERLSGALAKRPAPERLHERNILPGPGAEQQAVARREILSHSLLNRPAPDRLKERNILQGPEAEQQAVARRQSLTNSLLNRPPPDQLQNILQPPESVAAKRKRLEGLVAERPLPERVEHVQWNGCSAWGGLSPKQ